MVGKGELAKDLVRGLFSMSKVVGLPLRATRQRLAQMFSRALKEHGVADAPDDYQEVMESLRLPPSRDRILPSLAALAISSALSLKLLAAISAATFAWAAPSQAPVHQLNFASARPDGDLIDVTTSGPWTAADTTDIGVRGQIDRSAITGMSDFASADHLLVAIGDHGDFSSVSDSADLDTFGSATPGLASSS